MTHECLAFFIVSHLETMQTKLERLIMWLVILSTLIVCLMVLTCDHLGKTGNIVLVSSSKRKRSDSPILTKMA